MGTYDGGGFTIRNLVVESPDTSYAGLFGRVHAGTIKNVNVEAQKIAGKKYAGTIVGYMGPKGTGKGYIINCTAYTQLLVGEQCGGIVGRASAKAVTGSDKDSVYILGCTDLGSTINAAKDNAYMEGSDTSCHIGGIIGTAGGALIAYCASYDTKITNSATLTSWMSLGGIIGTQGCDSMAAYVVNCASTAQISMPATAVAGEKVYLGGIVGRASHAGTGLIANCVAAPTIVKTATSTFGGAMAGTLKTITNIGRVYTTTGSVGTDEALVGQAATKEYATAAELNTAEVVALLNVGNTNPVWKIGINGLPEIDWAQAKNNTYTFEDDFDKSTEFYPKMASLTLVDGVPGTYVDPNPPQTTEEVVTTTPETEESKVPETNEATKVPETNEATQAPETNAVTNAATNAPDTTAADDGGCGSAIAGVIAVLAVLGTAVAIKRK